MTDDNQIQIPGIGTDYSISWEEVNNPDNNGSATGNGSTTITFPSAGTYSVSITPDDGTFNGIRFFESADPRKILSVDQWGDIVWSELSEAFNGCLLLDCHATDIPDLSQVTSLEHMFKGCGSLDGPANIGDWDIGNVTNLRGMFVDAIIFNQDIGTWNTQNVTAMREMFFGAITFNQDIGTWNTQNVVNMAGMFKNARAFNQDLNDWNTDNLAVLSGTFYGATAFNQNIGNWNTENVLSMTDMFREATNFNQDIGSWNTQNVRLMMSMFADASSFNQNIGSWNVESVTTMRDMFFKALDFNQDLQEWNVSNVNSMFSMFEEATSFNQDLGNWVFREAADLRRMLNGCGMDCENYTSSLNRWSNNPNTSESVQLDAVGVEYGRDAVEAIDYLLFTKFWFIEGGRFVDENCLTTTSTYQSEGASAITIWPNPVSDRIYVEVPQDRILTVYDLAGRSHLKIQISAGESQVPIEHLAPGMYLFHFGDGAWHKVVVQ